MIFGNGIESRSRLLKITRIKMRCCNLVITVGAHQRIA